MKIYPAKKTGLFTYVLFGVMLLVLGIFMFDVKAFVSNPLVLIVLLLPVILLLWIYFDTYYALEDAKLYYRSAFLRGNIEVHQIRSITQNTNMYVGLKPALAMNGMVITYNRFDKIYIAPESNTALINALLEINENIEVKIAKKKK